MIVFVLFILALAGAILGLGLSFISAASAQRLTKWWLITISIVMTPIAITAALEVLIQTDLVGVRLGVALIPAGAAAYALGSIGEGYGETRRVALRVIGWSLMVAPMIVSLSLSVFLPLPLFLVFFLHPRWERTNRSGRVAERVSYEQL